MSSINDDFSVSKSEACINFIYSKFDDYKKILDNDQQSCDNMIASIRKQLRLYNHDDEKLRLLTGFNKIELTNQLDYFEQEAFKTNEENKACMLDLFEI